MVKQTISWFRRYWNDPNVLALFALLTLVIFIFATLSKILIPVFASIVIAYLLQWAVERLERYMPRRLAVLLVCIGFLALLAVAIIGILPPLWRQLSNLANELPNTIGKGQALLMHLPERYPDYISSSQMQQFLNEFKLQLGRLGQMLLSASITFIPSMIAVVIYLVLVPLLVYFFLMDKNKILQWFTPYLPRNRRLISQVWHEVHAQIGKYIAGKLIEMAIVWVVCFIVFWGMGLQYAGFRSKLFVRLISKPQHNNACKNKRN
jgi:putative permease